MSTYYLLFTLKSDTTFGRGDGVAGDVDAEVMHDDWGLPYLGGRAIKGILVNECADILAALPNDERKKSWQEAAARLFGRPGSTERDQALLSIGDAQLPEDVRMAVEKSTLKTIEQRWAAASGTDSAAGKPAFVSRQRALLRAETLETLTATRQQTAMEMSGVPKEHSLRVQRVILRETPFEARLEWLGNDDEKSLALLHACVKAFRRAGTSRNRGRGLLEAKLLSAARQPAGVQAYQAFKSEYEKEQAS